MLTQKTYVPSSREGSGKWFVVDASDKVLGRIATQIADLLRGKNKPIFAPNTDCGDFVVVVNSEKVKLTGKKWEDKIYYRHSNHIGGLKERTAKEQLERHPELLVYNAVKGMLPKGSLGRKQLTRLKVIIGENHPHEAQSPVEVQLKD